MARIGMIIGKKEKNAVRMEFLSHYAKKEIFRYLLILTISLSCEKIKLFSKTFLVIVKFDYLGLIYQVMLTKQGKRDHTRCRLVL
jgi:hypothetical protein